MTDGRTGQGQGQKRNLNVYHVVCGMKAETSMYCYFFPYRWASLKDRWPPATTVYERN